jgi:RND superfamily putative drug exporter
MVLLGRRAWWLPRWLDRIVPHVSIEGEEFFAKRDAELAAPAPAPAPAEADG